MLKAPILAIIWRESIPELEIDIILSYAFISVVYSDAFYGGLGGLTLRTNLYELEAPKVSVSLIPI